MFKFKRNKKVNKKSLENNFLSSKPLIYIPEYGESVDDAWPHLLWQKVFKGEIDVPIARAEIDLRKAMHLLSFAITPSISSFHTLAALSLPGTVTALFWVAQTLIQGKYQRDDLDNLIYYQNHDARLLFQQLSSLNLDNWYKHAINWISINQLSTNTKFLFPPGHPVLGQFYRKHPLSKYQSFYYPVTDYFSLVFEERKQALLRLLGALGATQVIISPVQLGNLSDSEEAQREIIKYHSHSKQLTSKPDLSKDPWLAYELPLQSLVDACFERNKASLRYELNLDVMNMLRTNIQTINSLVAELSSMELPANYEEILSAEFLVPRKFEVYFDNL